MVTKREREQTKIPFKQQLKSFVDSLLPHVSGTDKQWTVKGFIDIYRNVYTISADTKIISKILEIHIFPKIIEFAREHSYRIVLADYQNYYPDISFVSEHNPSVKFALDIKTTYRLPNNPEFCNGFTLGSHGSYFINRKVRKNIQFPYSEYMGHFCLGVVYTRTDSKSIDETKVQPLEQLRSIVSVVKDFQFFVCEKWEIASDSHGSGNTANIGSIVRIEDLLIGNGTFRSLGEKWFDDYWMNYGRITITGADGKQKKITKLSEILEYRGYDSEKINPCIRPKKLQGKSKE